MAGYMTRLVGSDGIYEGNYKAGEALENGVFVSIAADGTVKKLTAAGDIIFKVAKKEDLWGKKAVRLDVVTPGAGTVYFTENVNPGTRDEYDDIDGTVAIGEFVRMHIPLQGEQLIMAVADATYAALAEGDQAKPASGGSIAKYTA